MTNYGVEIDKTFEFLQANKFQQCSENSTKKLIFFVGLTGSGKSTLVQFLSGNQNLIAKRTGDRYSDLYIDDGNDKIGGSTILSKTFDPEFFEEPQSRSIFVDCPGFADTRSTSHDIAATFLTQKALRMAEEIKIIVVCSHYAVQKGVDRSALTKLLEHLAVFLKNIANYESSIGLIVSKVESRYIESPIEKYNLVSDDAVINQVGVFLKEVKQDLNNRKKNKIREAQLELLDVLITKKNGKFSKIALFQRPLREGPLHLMPIFQEQKIRMETLWRRELQFSDSSTEDFGLTISDKSKNEIRIMIEILDEKMETIAQEIVVLIKEHYIDIMKNLPHHKKWQNLILNLRNLIKKSDSKIENINEAPFYLQEWIRGVNIDTGVEEITNAFAALNERTQFLKKLIHDDSNLPAIKSLNLKLITTLKQINRRMLHLIAQSGSSNYEKILHASKTHYESIIKQSNDYQKLADNLQKAVKSFREKTSTDNYDDNASGVVFWLAEHGIYVPGNVMTEHFELQWYYNIIGESIQNAIPTEHEKLLSKLPQQILYPLLAMANWQTFIWNAFQKLTTFAVQEKLKVNEINNMKLWPYFKNQLEKSSISVGYDYSSKRSLNKREQDQLDNIVETALNSQNVRAVISNSEILTIKGYVVRISDVVKNIVEGVKKIHIFALHTIIIDTSINLEGVIQEMYVIAPVWYISDQCILNISGANGGNFIGSGLKFINENRLTIKVEAVVGEITEMPQSAPAGTYENGRTCEDAIKAVNGNNFKKLNGRDGEGNASYYTLFGNGNGGESSQKGARNGVVHLFTKIGKQI
jgi:GTP-binding protein EngB required for normal cell division